MSRYHAAGIMRHLGRLGHSLAAGAVAGAALAPVQLLLWEDVRLPFAKASLAFLAWATWGSLWLGLFYFVILELFALVPANLLGRNGFSLPLWRRLMAANSLLVASVAVWNRHETRDLLLPANRQALAVVAWLTGLYGIVLLALVLRRTSRLRSPAIAWGASTLLVAALWGIWAMTPPAEPPLAGTDTPTFKAARNLLFVSWEGADLPWLLPILERGDMPFLQSRRDHGAWGQLRTMRPYTRSASLATVVTGCAPAVHGVLGKRSYRLSWLLDHPVTLLLAGPWRDPHQVPWAAWERVPGASPKRAPIWTILDRSGRPAGNAGWPRWSTGGWDLQAPLAAEATRFEELDSELLAALSPALATAPEAARDARRAFAIASDLHQAVLRRTESGTMGALVVNTRLVSQLRPAWTPAAPGDPSDETLRQAARLLDDQVHQLWSRLGGEATLLVVVSPYGMAPPSPWRRLGHLVGHTSEWRVSPSESPDGFVLFSGPGVRPGERLRARRLADVVPTVLYLLELPVARDMAGGVILEAVSDEHTARVPLRRVASYPPTVPDTPRHAPQPGAR